jgi:hypothetical protein
MNLHAPERQAHESMEQYRERRAMSKRVMQHRTRTGPFNTAKGGISSRKSLRDGQRENGALRGTYGAGIVAALARKTRESLERALSYGKDRALLRDEHGAFTFTGAQPCEPWQGQKRRMWVAGISAQRGY